MYTYQNKIGQNLGYTQLKAIYNKLYGCGQLARTFWHYLKKTHKVNWLFFLHKEVSRMNFHIFDVFLWCHGHVLGHICQLSHLTCSNPNNLELLDPKKLVALLKYTTYKVCVVFMCVFFPLARSYLLIKFLTASIQFVLCSLTCFCIAPLTLLSPALMCMMGHCWSRSSMSRWNAPEADIPCQGYWNCRNLIVKIYSHRNNVHTRYPKSMEKNIKFFSLLLLFLCLSFFLFFPSFFLSFWGIGTMNLNRWPVKICPALKGK